ncbi:hypothetical protein A2U01_0044045, partial [Trifolium medium]|nr:hypothetical protein [Trifolium medium]
ILELKEAFGMILVKNHAHQRLAGLWAQPGAVQAWPGQVSTASCSWAQALLRPAQVTIHIIDFC